MYETSTTSPHVERPSLGMPLQRVLSNLRPALHRAVTESWPDTPLSPSQARLLRIVRLRPGIAAPEIAQELREEPSVASATIEELVQRELLAREPDPDDRRAHRLRLTMRGRLRNRAWRGKSTEVLDRALDTLTPQERAAIAIAIPSLERLADAVAAQHHD
jgi:DNA-binding MarR family transcriptional regulator